MRELWQYYQMLSEVITRATEMRKTMPRLWASSTAGTRELEQLLTGPSISLPPVQTLLAQRGLFGLGDRADGHAGGVAGRDDASVPGRQGRAAGR